MWKINVFLTCIILVLSFINISWALPFDDGKYKPIKYYNFDDGKYYRPLDEGKYVPGDEGRYTYIYRQGLYPGDDGDYRYIHEEGPKGPDGSDGYPGGRYLGHKIYADKYKHNDFNIEKYVPYNAEQSESQYNKIDGNDEDLLQKCSVFLDGLKENQFNISSGRLVSQYKVQGEKKINAVTAEFSKKLRYVYQVSFEVYEED